MMISLAVLLMIITTLLWNDIDAFQYVFYKNRPFPIDLASRQIIFGNGSESGGNNTGGGNQTDNQCIQSSIGDMVCDSINNKPECQYDGGDCCQGTCKATCDSKLIDPSECKCGSNSYDCKSNNAPCVNCFHGKCETDMSLCFSDEELIRLGVLSCTLNSITQGTSESSDYYCGKDPNKTVVHYLNAPSFHYLGCGIKAINCTENPCCQVVLLNDDRYENCDDVKRSRYVWDAAKKTYILQFTSCISYFRKCFKENAAGISHGQCCQCLEGWGGTHCDVPLCKKCSHGTCVDENVCVCDPDYQGPGCNQAICVRCVNGICIEPNVCECFYGYEGSTCEQKVTYPMCVYGYSSGQDRCNCNSGYTGLLCEIKACPSNCDFCDDENNCILDLSKQCDLISPFCIDCSDGKCLKCDLHYVLDSDTCLPLNVKWPNCFKGDSAGCTECIYPYRYDPISKTCVSNGMIEISSKYQSALETDGSITITFNRYYGTDHQCIVFYELLPIFSNDQAEFIYNPLNKMELSTGEIEFSNGEDTKQLIFILYANSYPIIESVNAFQLTIYNPIGGCIIGDISQSQIEIYDDKIIDLKTLKIKVLSTGLTIVNGKYQIFSSVVSFDFDARINQSLILTFLVTISHNQNTSVFSSKMTYNGLRYKISIFYNQLKYPTNFIGEKTVSVLFCENGSYYKMKYYDYAGINREDVPYYVRIVKTVTIDEYYLTKSYFSIEWSFFIDNPNKILSIDVTISIEDLITFRVNNNEYKGIETPIGTDGLRKKITYDIGIIDPILQYIEISFSYVHLKGGSFISISYSYDKNTYVSFDDSKKYACHSVQEYNLMIY